MNGAAWALVVFVIALVIGVPTYLAINWNYRWVKQCAEETGVEMHNASGSRVCVRAPVEIITIAARPW